ncbi:MAG TPA: hypothetical protein VLB46_01460 [Pyrinomonadaceae bacterium]|nr:hypothetical protein [Pyrinomonadaceae bacterium]
MPEKLRLIREHLQASQPDMQVMLKLPKSCRISEYENGVREPTLIVTLASSRLGKVSMASVVDDEVNLNEFRKQLGKFELRSLGKMAKLPTEHATEKASCFH